MSDTRDKQRCSRRTFLKASGAAGAALRHYLQDRGIPMRWWKWILFTGWVVLFGFTIAFITTSVGENETTAAFKGAVAFGLPTIILGVGIWRLLKVGAKHRRAITAE